MIPGILTPPPLLRETGATYIGGQANTTNSSTLATLGALAGDLLVILGVVGGSTALSGGGALTAMAGTGFYKALVSGDLSSRVTNSSQGCTVLIYRGAVSCTRVTTDTSALAMTDRSVTGITKNAAHCGLVAEMSSQTLGAVLSLSSPPSFATRASYTPGNDQPKKIVDRLQPVNPIYINATVFLWSSDQANNSLSVYELRSA